MPPMMTVTGMVIIQAMAIWPASPQRTIFTLSAEPAPTIEEPITWVVLTGAPPSAALRITAVLATCDVNACTARMR